MMPLAILVAVALVLVVGVAFFVLRRRKPAVSASSSSPYQTTPLLTPAERSFFGVLEHALRGRYTIFAKVRMADVLTVRHGVEARQAQLNRIVSKHIDFLLCDPHDLAPVLAIELDDRSHRRTSAQARDAFVDEALAGAGLPLLRVPAGRAYEPAAILDLVVTSVASATSLAKA
jgi:very-short-patch-repair endonuclease